MSYTANFSVTGGITESQTFQLGAPKSTANLNNNRNYTAGSGSNQVNLGFSYTETLAPAGSTTHVLSDGTTKTLLKEDGTFTAVKHILIKNTGDTNALTVSGNFFGISTEDIDIGPGGHIDIDYGTGSGEAVTATTKDDVTLASTGGTSYSIEIAGVGSIA